KMILRRYLQPLRHRQIDTLVLGCTHYPLLKHLIAPRIGKQVRLIDSSIEMVSFVCDFLDRDPAMKERLCNSGKSSRFYVSDTTEAIEQMAARIFGRPVKLHTV
ncbi:MAG: glutamate racemase, partial [Desulfobulbaceae bacterium]|nr:glutamate racemase [Desulfobulbaceae bacterium]